MKKRTQENKYGDIISIEDFLSFSIENIQYKKLHEEWVKSDYKYKLTPSIDRINCKMGYIINNIQFLTVSDNCKKSHIEYSHTIFGGKRKINDTSKKVKLIKEDQILFFDSGKKACDFLGYQKDAVANAISRKHKVGGYIAEYI
jgi:hypothetical protein